MSHTTDHITMFLVRARAELYSAAQILKGEDLAEFTALIKEIAMVLDLIPLAAPVPVTT